MIKQIKTDNGPSGRVESQSFEFLVKGEGVHIPVEVLTLDIDFEAIGHFAEWGIYIALGRGLDFF